MSDQILAVYFVLLCGVAAAWFLAFKAIVGRLRSRHEATFSVLFGTPERRKNGMDKFFALFAFLFQDKSALRDIPLVLACALVKALTAIFLLVFVAMMFTPFFLQLGARH